jgi:hypothetical protein
MHMSQGLFYLTTALHISGVTITHLQVFPCNSGSPNVPHCFIIRTLPVLS